MQRENVERSEYGLGRSLRQFWGVMQEMSRMLEVAHGMDANPGSRSREWLDEWSPQMSEMPDGSDLLMYFELPGVEREDVDLSLHGKSLVVSGVKKKFPSFESLTVEDFVSGRAEIGAAEHSPFKRVVELPRPVEEEEVEAGFGAGILQVRVADAAEPRSQRIHIRGGRYPRR